MATKAINVDLKSVFEGAVSQFRSLNPNEPGQWPMLPKIAAWSLVALVMIGLGWYFLLADAHSRFHYLQLGLAIILVYVGIKMILSNWYHIPTPLSLGFIALVLVVAIVASIRRDDGGGDGVGVAVPQPEHVPPDHA